MRDLVGRVGHRPLVLARPCDIARPQQRRSAAQPRLYSSDEDADPSKCPFFGGPNGGGIGDANIATAALFLITIFVLNRLLVKGPHILLFAGRHIRRGVVWILAATSLAGRAAAATTTTTSLARRSVLLTCVPASAAAYGGLPERKGRISRTCNGSLAPECAPSPLQKSLSDLLDEQVERSSSSGGSSNKSSRRLPENGPLQFHRGTEDRLVSRVLARATSGSPSSVLSEVDDFCWSEHWMMNVGPEKGRVVDEALQRSKPTVVVEFGTYVGYSAVRWASQLPPGGRLWSVDPDPASQAAAGKLLTKAGLRARVTLLRARASDAIPTLQRELDGRPIDVLFIDHAKQEYLPDLKRVEEAGLLRAGSVIAADNVVFFGLDDYVDHVRNSGRYSSSRTYTASLEYDGRPKGEAFADGVEVSVYKG